MKIFFKLLLCFLVLSVIPVQAKSVKFAVVSDIDYSPTFNKKSAEYTDGAKILKGFVDRTYENKYDFIVFLGDNISKSKKHFFNGFLELASQVDAPYYLVMGDKDVHKISGLSKTEYLDIVSSKNKYQKNKDASYSFAVTKDIVAIVLDGVSSGMPSTHGVFTKKTLQWLDTTLENNKNKKVVIFQHVPYVEPFDKPSYSMLDKQEYIAVLNRHRNILLVVSGHYGQSYVVKDEKGVYHVSVPALNKAPYYYNEIQIVYDKKPFKKAKNFQIDGAIKPAI